MTDQRYREIDEQLAELGWTYSPVSREFESISPSETDDSPSAEWAQVLLSLPGISEDEMREYLARKDKESDAEVDE